MVTVPANSGFALRPSAVVVDLLCTRIDGQEVLRGLTADPALADIPVVTLALGDRADGAVLRAAAYLAIPIHQDRLGAALADARRGVGGQGVASSELCGVGERIEVAGIDDHH